MYNHTGHAQVVEEWTSGDTEPTVTYTIGDDVISQYKTPQAPPVPAEGLRCLLYDGHGSTRQLAEADGTTIDDTFSYDAYGVMLGGNPTPGAPAATNLLYAGEQWDNSAQSYYLRARYYDPLNGRFNRMDPYAGSPQDPQSLHKYLYCHNNPVNGIDPSGLMGLPALQTRMATDTQLRLHQYASHVPLARKALAIATIIALAAAQVLSSGYWNDPYQELANEECDFVLAQRIVANFVVDNALGIDQEAFNDLERKLRYRRRRNTKEIPVYIHYGFKNTADIFATGVGLKAGSWCTKQVYPTGWHAKYYCAQLWGPPRNAIYIIIAHGNTTIYGPTPVRGRWDNYSGKWLAGRGIFGQGMEWYFPNGTGPGTVFGPIPIKEGTYEEVK
ncbi:MAG: RHS repeat-associated core domain-containing protein [Planctomycetota bacterium]|jgi:RHS repeat-associated protein